MNVASMQDRVRKTRALVLGAGGIGAWLAQSLAMMGVAELIVVDPDVVEDRNRTRQPYPADSVGRRKVEVLGEIVTGLRPGLRYTGVDLRVEQPGRPELARRERRRRGLVRRRAERRVRRRTCRGRVPAGPCAASDRRLQRTDRTRRPILAPAPQAASLPRLSRAGARHRRPRVRPLQRRACCRCTSRSPRGGQRRTVPGRRRPRRGRDPSPPGGHSPRHSWPCRRARPAHAAQPSLACAGP